MNLVKEEYAAILQLLHRVEVKGIQEAQALLLLAQKLEHKVKNWVEPAEPVVELNKE